MNAMLRLRLCGLDLELGAPREQIQILSRFWSPARVHEEDPTRLKLNLVQTGADWWLELPEEAPRRLSGELLYLAFNFELLNWLLRVRRNSVFFHAGLILLGELPLLLVGESGQGKSSFCRALLRRGGTYLADDLLALEEGQLMGAARVVQFEHCLTRDLPEHYADCSLLPAGGSEWVVPIHEQVHPVLHSLKPRKDAVLVSLSPAAQTDHVTPLGPLERLAELYGASLKGAAPYRGELNRGPTYKLSWRTPEGASQLLLARLRADGLLNLTD